MNQSFLAGQVAIVTGGTKGIGKAVAAELLRAGATVRIGARREDPEALGELAALGPVTSAPLDVRDPASVEAFFRDVTSLNILVNNAGVGLFRPVEELSIEDWQRTIETNLNGVFYCSRLAIPLMKRGGGGSIVNIGSLAGQNPFAAGAAYNASKFGLNGFGEAMMLDHRQDGIRVTAVLPGSVNTGFGDRGALAGDWMIQPEDIAQIVLDVLAMPERTLISRVEVRPARPRK